MNLWYGYVLFVSGFGLYFVLIGVSWFFFYGVKKYNFSLIKNKGFKFFIWKFMSYGFIVYIVLYRVYKVFLNMDDNM